MRPINHDILPQPISIIVLLFSLLFTIFCHLVRRKISRLRQKVYFCTPISRLAPNFVPLNYKYSWKKLKQIWLLSWCFRRLFRVEERRTHSQNILQNEPCLSSNRTQTNEVNCAWTNHYLELSEFLTECACSFSSIICSWSDICRQSLAGKLTNQNWVNNKLNNTNK